MASKRRNMFYENKKQKAAKIEQDALPTAVCLSCITKLNTSFELRMTCMLAQAKLQQLTCRTNVVPPVNLINKTPAKAVEPQTQQTLGTPSIAQSERCAPQQQHVEAAKPGKLSHQIYLYPNQDIDPPPDYSPKNNVLNMNGSCGLAIESVHSLDAASVERTRKKNRRTVCQYCRKWFPRSIIEHHENLHIKGGVFFTCINCNNNFRTKQEFSTHSCD
ncbi:hypothetical protein AAG570_002395 [Ranatra chinensis]|uniref:C2H2-type domain-containing protein n=1 Tax=Ranatra chinensis TaxID=642074 RepID=A0ABD0Y8D8_9HEMI